ncbi:MAG: hypothetical protein HQ518_30730 [Rhodopirellula sp.]|nr:hypothetical protein [Rhodopirellula sp.]
MLRLTSIEATFPLKFQAWLALILLVGLSGCGRESTGPLELTTDQIELKEREAIERLKELGCKVAEVDDPLIGIPGIMVTLFSEHLTTTGLIRTDVMSQFRYLRNLFLVVDATPISADGLLQLRTLNNLLIVSAQWTPTSNKGLSSIEGIVSLRLLRLNWTLVNDDGLRHIERLPKLAMLYLTGTPVTDKVVSHIKVLNSLKALQLSHTGVTDAGIAELKGFADLTHFGLEGTVVTDASIPVLASFKSLKYLNISDTDLTAEGKQKLREALPDCDVETAEKPKPPMPTFKHPGVKRRQTLKTPDTGSAAPKSAAPKSAAPKSAEPKSVEAKSTEPTPVESQPAASKPAGPATSK